MAEDSAVTAGALSPAPSADFQALPDDGTVIPPDTQGAAGLDRLMVTLNSQIRIQDKAGNTLSTVSLASFWSSLGSGSPFDPRIAYDPFNNRWIFAAGAGAESSGSAILIGVSQSGDPAGNWNLYQVAADAQGTLWADFPSLGFNGKWIVVQANMFTVSGNSFAHSNIWAFDKANLYAGGSGAYTLLQSTTGFTQSPAATYDNSLGTEYLLENWNGGAGELRLSQITGAVGSETLTEGIAYPAASAQWQDAAPTTNFAPQLGSSEGIDTDDDRILNCVYRNSSLWAAHTVYLPASGTVTRSAAQWWQIDMAAGALGRVLQFSRIDDPAGATFYAYPSIAVNKNNDALIGYSRFSASQYASAAYSLRMASDPASTTEGDALLMAGEAPYYQDFGTGDNRWGDYSNTVVDPVNDTDFWTIQEYASFSNNWGTWWGKLAMASPTPSPTPSATPTPSPSPSATPTPVPSPTPTPRPLTIGTVALPDANAVAAYAVSLNISGGRAPYIARLSAGSLPPGIRLSSASGTIAGMPVRAGVYRFLITVTDTDGGSATAALELIVN
jgi:hypothetical protein